MQRRHGAQAGDDVVEIGIGHPGGEGVSHGRLERSAVAADGLGDRAFDLTIGPSAEPNENATTAAPLAGENPLFIARGDKLVSVGQQPGRRIALTFDDGPSPLWTPEILAYLHSHHLPATFFTIGSQATQYRGLIHQEAREGFEIGNHTLTHTALSNGPMWSRKLQLDMTESILVGLTGHYHRLLRPPYSATPGAVTPNDERNLAKLTNDRYIVVLTNYDSEDWQRPGVARIVRNATPAQGRGGIIMFHDGGGNRSQTLAALKVLVPELRAQGYRFVNVSALLDASKIGALGTRARSSLTVPLASTFEHARAWVFTAALALAFVMTRVLQIFVLIIGAVSYTSFTLPTISAL